MSVLSELVGALQILPDDRDRGEFFNRIDQQRSFVEAQSGRRVSLRGIAQIRAVLSQTLLRETSWRLTLNNVKCQVFSLHMLPL
jgi:hypothetical protein